MPDRCAPAVLGALLCVAATACNQRIDRDPGNVTVVGGRSTIAPAVAPPSPSPTATPSAIATPHPPRSLADMHPRKLFKDPPLPPELRDDGGLIPLPPPPGNNR